MSSHPSSPSRQPDGARRQVLWTGGFVALMCSAPIAAKLVVPDEPLTLGYPALDLERQIPVSFGEWRIDTSMAPLVADPTLEASVRSTYDQNVARTYINASGHRVMLTVAYGADQAAEATQVHRPEICYGAQGFVVSQRGDEVVALANHSVRVRRLYASLGPRQEPITYWVTLGDRASLPGLRRKLEQIRVGLQGKYADGLLMRVSTIAPDQSDSYLVHDRFLVDLFEHVSADVRPRYFGQ